MATHAPITGAPAGAPAIDENPPLAARLDRFALDIQSTGENALALLDGIDEFSEGLTFDVYPRHKVRAIAAYTRLALEQVQAMMADAEQVEIISREARDA